MTTDSNHTSGSNPTRMLNAGGSVRLPRHRSFPFTLLDRYEVQAPLGSGGMGDVALAKDRDLGRLVAIKWIRGDLAQSPHAIQRFFQEAKAAAALNHPNIVQIYDRGSDEGDEFFVMEYVDGESLGKRLERGPLDLDECIRITIAVCDALQAAHDHGIVHRDVKPANIVLTASGVPKLTDFGVARHGGDSEMTVAGSTVGTPVYMAPEQAKNVASASPKSDQYSLVATLYHMLTGESPARILERRVPDVLREVAVRGTEPDPELRFPTISDFKLALCEATGVSAASVSAQHATGNAVETLKRQKERVRQIHEAARRLAFEQHDWLLARTTLQQIPESVRDEKLWADVSDKAEQVDSLNRSINKAVEQMQWKGLNLAIEALLTLQPQRTDLQQLRDQLDDRECLNRSSLGAPGNEALLREIQKQHPGLRYLNDQLEILSLRAAVEKLIPLEAKDLRLEMLEPLGAYLRSNDNSTRSSADALYEKVIGLATTGILSVTQWHTDQVKRAYPNLTDLSSIHTLQQRANWTQLLIMAGFLFAGCGGCISCCAAQPVELKRPDGGIALAAAVMWTLFWLWIMFVAAKGGRSRRPLEHRLRYQYPKDPLTPAELEKRKAFAWWDAPFNYPPGN